MLRVAKMFLTPRWIAAHLFVWTIALAMVWLGRWQLRVSDEKHFDLQNFGYAFQWWAFSAFAVLFWLRMMRDTVRGGPRGGSVGGGQLVVRGGQLSRLDGVAYAGPADLVARADKSGEVGVAYRGYLMPQSTTNPVRSGGDPFHASYNDYLWQLGLSDSGGRSRQVDPRAFEAGPFEARPGEGEPSGTGQIGIRAIDASAIDATPIDASATDTVPTDAVPGPIGSGEPEPGGPPTPA